jgi:dipeptidyl aminopeptidase/acylaminoacyl peptidase
LTESWDRSPSALAFAPGGKEIYGVADDLGQSALFAVDVATGKPRTVRGQGHIQAPQTGGSRVVFTMDTLKGPAELYSCKPDGSDLVKITSINDNRLAAVRLGEPEQFTFKGAGGDTVYGYIVKPVDFDPGKKYPIAFLIHGGPQGSFSNDFHYRWNPQTYAGRGYAAVMIDFHGSTGYGQAFTDAIRNDWGGKPLDDLKKGRRSERATADG